jgi:two-component system, LytTR family, response regulator LytT
MNILIAEDEAIIAESLYQVLLELGYNPAEPAYSSAEAIECIDLLRPDIALVDIHIGEQFSGFEVAAALNLKEIPFIFVTALYDKETVKRASEFNPAAYLVKPFNKENLFTTIELALSKQSSSKNINDSIPENIFIKNGTQTISISPADITYIEADGKYVSINLISGKKHLLRVNLNEIIQDLKVDSLVQVHKSFIINIVHIKAIKYDEIMVNNFSIPIGRNYRDDFKKKIAQ